MAFLEYTRLVIKSPEKSYSKSSPRDEQEEKEELLRSRYSNGNFSRPPPIFLKNSHNGIASQQKILVTETVKKKTSFITTACQNRFVDNFLRHGNVKNNKARQYELFKRKYNRVTKSLRKKFVTRSP